MSTNFCHLINISPWKSAWSFIWINFNDALCQAREVQSGGEENVMSLWQWRKWRTSQWRWTMRQILIRKSHLSHRPTSFHTWEYTNGREEGIFGIVRVQISHVVTELEHHFRVLNGLPSSLHVADRQGNAIGQNDRSRGGVVHSTGS